MSEGVQFAALQWAGRPLRLEYQWLGTADAAPLLVFLHEGLGSVAAWKDFPARLCATAGCRGLMYSRPGYGRSTPRAAGEHWGPDFMHRQAFDLLPALLQALGVKQPPWLFGHSDGGSIALLHASRFEVAGVVAVAPHTFVEDISIASIERARIAFESTDLPQRLGRYHDSVESAFWGWNRAWLGPRFRSWNIEAELRSIRAPVLAAQGVDDEYGTLAQIHSVQRAVPHAQLLELPRCGHAAHRDQPEALIEATVNLMRGGS